MSLYPGFKPYPVDPEWRTGGRLAVAAAARRLGLVIPSAPTAAKPSPARVSPYLAKRAAIRAKIRRSPGWIGGYAAVHYSKHGRSKDRPAGIWYSPGCFDRAVHATGILLLRNHESGFVGAVFARKDEDLILTADSYGLWFEASAPGMLATINAGGATCSLGCERFEYNGKSINEVVGLWEISVLDRTKTALCPQTWVRHGSTALSFREGIIADYRQKNPYRIFSVD